MITRTLEKIIRASSSLPYNILIQLWDILSDVPVNEAGEIEEAWLGFEPLTPREDIWHWFEEMNPQFIVGEVMEGKR